MLTPRDSCSVILTMLLIAPNAAWAQGRQAQVTTPQQGAGRRPQGQTSTAQIPPMAESLRPSYVLGTGDVIQIRGFGDQDLAERTFRIEQNGEIVLPIIDSIKAAGLTVEQFQTELNNRLSAFYRNPQALVTLVQFRSEPVFFIGAFNSPGIYPLQGRRTLVEMLTLVGSLTPNASRRIRLTRRNEMGPIPLPNAVADATGKGMTVEIPLNALTRDINPPEDLLLMPYDLVSAERAELVYLTGQVTKPGGYELGEKETISALQVLSLAGGYTSDAAPKKARILRPIANSSRRAEIPINLKEAVEGPAEDVRLMPGDVLFVPRNAKIGNLGRVAQIAIPVVSSLAIGLLVYRRTQ
ncbi:MAG: polysaccharide biosynthesis/export family protein [Bryobacteraceae bacterium]